MKNLKEVMAGIANNSIRNLEYCVNCKVSGEELDSADVFLTSKACKFLENFLQNENSAIVTGQVQRGNSFSFKELVVGVTGGERDNNYNFKRSKNE